MAEACLEGDGFMPGMIAMVQTFGSETLAWNPHIHALATRGGWDQDGHWVPVPFIDGEAAAALFRHKVFTSLQAEGLLSEERTRLLLSWRHSGLRGHRDTVGNPSRQPPPNLRAFGRAPCSPPTPREVSVHNAVTVAPGDREGLERLCRYMLRPPVSLQRLAWDEDADTVTYTPRPGHHHRPNSDDDLHDPKELLARAVMHIPEPRRHLVRYYGTFSNVVRARRKREIAGGDATPSHEALPPPSNPDMRAMRRALLRRIFEVDPLVCPRCGGAMRIIAFITEPKVIRQALQHLAAKGAHDRGPPAAPSDHAQAA